MAAGGFGVKSSSPSLGLLISPLRNDRVARPLSGVLVQRSCVAVSSAQAEIRTLEKGELLFKVPRRPAISADKGIGPASMTVMETGSFLKPAFPVYRRQFLPIFSSASLESP